MMNQKTKDLILTLVKVGLAITVFHFILKRLGPKGWSEIVHYLSSAKIEYLLAALAILLLITFLGAFRWMLLLRTQHIVLPKYSVFWMTAVGNFFNAFLVGTGGDVSKGWYVAGAVPGKKPQALLSIGIDRVIGLFALLVLAGISVLFNYNELKLHDETKGIAFAVMTSVFGTFGMLVISTQRRWISRQGWWAHVWGILPHKEIFSRLSDSYNQYARYPRTLVATFVISVAGHLFSIFAAYLIGCAMHVEGITLRHYIIYCPLINTFSAIFPTPGGVGAREAAYAYFLSLHGVPRSQAVALGFLFGVGTYAVSFVCGFIYLFGKPKKLEEIQVRH